MVLIIISCGTMLDQYSEEIGKNYSTLPKGAVFFKRLDPTESGSPLVAMTAENAEKLPAQG